MTDFTITQAGKWVSAAPVLWRGVPIDWTLTIQDFTPNGEWLFYADVDYNARTLPCLEGICTIVDGKIRVQVENTNTTQLAERINAKNKIRLVAILGNGETVIPLAFDCYNVIDAGTPTPVEEYYTKAQIDAIIAAIPTGTTDYDELDHKPQINGHTLTGDQSAADLGLATPADIPPAQVQADWNEADTSSKAYIQNKPTIPTVPVQSVNSKTGAVVLDAADVDAMAFDGMPVEALTSATIPAAGKIYTFTATAAAEFVFPTPVSGAENLFEIDLTMPDPAVTVTWPSGLTWKFATPSLTAGTTSALRFRHTGSNWEGWTTPDMSEYALVSNVVPKSGGRFTDTIKVGADDNVRNACFISNKAVGCSSLGAGFISASNWFTSNPPIPYSSRQNLILVNTWFSSDYLQRCVFVGDDFSVSGRNSCVFALGRGLIVPTNRTDVFITGEYNVDTDAYFVVGNGTSTNDRHNCFVVDRSGNVTMSGDLTFTPSGGTATTLSALVARIEALEQAIQ